MGFELRMCGSEFSALALCRKTNFKIKRKSKVNKSLARYVVAHNGPALNLTET